MGNAHLCWLFVVCYIKSKNVCYRYNILKKLSLFYPTDLDHTPPQGLRTIMMSTKLLILDLDETLIHSVTAPLKYPCNFFAFPYYVYVRPYFDIFKDFCLSNFEVAVWTSASADYANTLTNNLFDRSGLVFCWSGERCTRRLNFETHQYEYIKDLKKVKKKQGYRLEDIIIVDDSPFKLSRQYGNLLPVSPFIGHPNDDELLFLTQYLPHLINLENVRRVDKRFWRDKVNRNNIPVKQIQPLSPSDLIERSSLNH